MSEDEINMRKIESLRLKCSQFMAKLENVEALSNNEQAILGEVVNID